MCEVVNLSTWVKRTWRISCRLLLLASIFLMTRISPNEEAGDGYLKF